MHNKETNLCVLQNAHIYIYIHKWTFAYRTVLKINACELYRTGAVHLHVYMSGFLKMVLKNCTPELDFTEL